MKKQKTKIKFTDLTKAEQDTIIANAGFTDRQLEIFNLKCKGKSIIAISQTIYISEAVVCNEISAIKDKISRSFKSDEEVKENLKKIIYLNKTA